MVDKTTSGSGFLARFKFLVLDFDNKEIHMDVDNFSRHRPFSSDFSHFYRFSPKWLIKVLLALDFTY